MDGVDVLLAVIGVLVFGALVTGNWLSAVLSVVITGYAVFGLNVREN